MNHCFYYQAQVNKKMCWLFVATLRSCEHVVFDRTIDKENSILEFLVPSDTLDSFLKIMELFKENNLVSDLQKLDNPY